MSSRSDRKTELAKIHIAAKQLGLSKDDGDPDRPKTSSYGQMLWAAARVTSSADLDAYGRRKVLQYLKDRGAKFKRKKRPTVAADKKAQVAKINAMLIAAGKQEPYADAIAKRMFGVEKFEWCTGEQLGKIIAAVAISNRKNNIDEA